MLISNDLIYVSSVNYISIHNEKMASTRNNKNSIFIDLCSDYSILFYYLIELCILNMLTSRVPDCAPNENISSL